jgi:uncharacterized protein YyaL (SSP411 family)
VAARKQEARTMPNRLATETSPYLLQHADNPVDWYPWSDEAFALARESGKPVLLSVGYSACHWCHVMAHESFEDTDTAELMNKLFVNIKVDREERPDVDKIYQTSYQLLTQRSGGWPLTMFLSPDTQRPFFGGTYFPPEASQGMPSFKDLLNHVAVYYREQADAVASQGDQLMEVFGRIMPQSISGEEPLDAAPLVLARDRLAKNFDREFGGFGDAPKFPHPTSIERLLRHWRASASQAEPDLDALFMATLSLTRIADGGLYDQLGGGFYRYSVDRFWQIPHFEKMLYDNGPLLALYAEAHLATGEAQFATIANETADWMLADMCSPEGAFYSTRDADSEGQEGLYYIWSNSEIEQLLPAKSLAAFRQRFGLDEDANFEGAWHLTIRKSLEDVAKETNSTARAVRKQIDASRKLLLAAREQRVAPGRDEKHLVSWNALAIRGFAIAGSALGRGDLIDAAAQAVDFIQEHMFVDGRLLVSYKDGKARYAAYLDDYAFLLDAILELLQARWSNEHLQFAVTLAEALLEYFEDKENGGFWFTANDHEALMHRPKPLGDEAVPSGNGIAALALQRLGFLLGETRYLGAAERTLRCAWQALEEYPHAHVSLLNVLEEHLAKVEIIIIRGEEQEIGRWRDSALQLYSPGRLVFAIPATASELPGALAERAAVEGETIAYRCLGTHCELPVTSWEALAGKMVSAAATAS